MLLAMGLACTPSGTTLELSETEVREIPGSLSLSGVHARGTTSVLWSSSPPSVVIQIGSRSIRIGEDRFLRPVAAAVIDGGSSVEVLDALRRSVTTYRSSGLLVSEQSVLLPFIPLTAARGVAGWFVSGPTMGDTVRIVHIESGPDAIRLVAALPPKSDGKQRLGTLEAMDSGVVFAEMASPYLVHILGDSSIELQPPVPEAATRQASASADSAVWVALRAVPIDSVFLQTLADLRSPKRILRVFTRTGRKVSVSRLDTPIGFAGIDVETRRVFAVRRLGQQQLVFYRWKWGAVSF